MALSDGRFWAGLLAAGLGVAAVGGAIDLQRWPTERVERFSFQGAAGRLEGKLWRPAASPRLGVLLCHGVETNKEVMDALAIEFTRRDAAALTFDYGGYGESANHENELRLMVGDTRAAHRELLGRVGELPVVVIGHSMGATFGVVFAGEEPTIRGAVALGNEPVSAEVPPRNVLYAMGVYDVFHSVEEMLATTRESAHQPMLEPNVTHGSFAAGTARAMATSPWVDHGPEPIDPVLVRRSLEWAAQSVPEAGLSTDGALREVGRQVAHVALLLGILMALLTFGARPAVAASRVLARWHLLAFAAFCLCGAWWPLRVVPLWADFALVALGAGMFSAALGHPRVARAEDPVRRRLLRWALVLALLGCCLLLGVLAVGLPGVWRVGYLSELWKGVVGIAAFRPAEGLGMLRGYAFRSYSEAVVPGWGLALVLLVELIRPGTWVAYAMKGLEIVVDKLAHLEPSISLKASRQSLIAGGLVLAVLLAVVLKRVSEGWIDSGTVSRLAGVGLRGLLLPLVLFGAACKVWRRILTGGP